MSPGAAPRYRYRITATLDLDDEARLGPEALEAAVRALLRVAPGRVVGGRVAVHLEELERLDPEGGA